MSATDRRRDKFGLERFKPIASDRLLSGLIEGARESALAREQMLTKAGQFPWRQSSRTS